LKKIGQGLSRIVSSALHSIVKLYTNEWEVHIWRDESSRVEYHFKHIDKINSKCLKGVLTTGEAFELTTQYPFNYQIKKVK
jgi:hypothetical protein